MNILLTCAGRCGNIIDYFRDALAGNGKIFACDSSNYAPALEHSDAAFIVPPATDNAYTDVLLDLCRKHEIRLLVPAFEPELLSLSARRCDFQNAGTTVLVSSPAVITLCYDKLATSAFLQSHRITTPPCYVSPAEAILACHSGQLAFPLVVKPRWGVSSLETSIVYDAEELQLAYRLAKKRIQKTFLNSVSASDPDRSILIQPYISGQEYGLDVINTLDGKFYCAYAKQKLRMRTGQTDIAVSCRDAALHELAQNIGSHLGHIGILDCDLITTPSGDASVLDLNPRLGRGYPLSHIAGANLPAILISWLRSETPLAEWSELMPNITVARCDAAQTINIPGAKP